MAAAIAGLGVLMIYINWAADEQRKIFRATKGKAKVWGQTPKFIKARCVPPSSSSLHSAKEVTEQETRKRRDKIIGKS